MKSRLALLGLCAVAAAAGAQTAIPQSAYRGGMPEVLTPAPVPNAAPAFNSAAFRTAYVKAGRPTIAVLWNREFTDMLQQGTATQVSVDTVRAGVATAEAVRVPGYRAAEVTGASVGSTTVTVGEVRTQQAQRAAPVERVDLEVRSAFMQTITGAGVLLVDRNVVMRTTAAKSKGGTLDSQQVETEALTRHAKLIMEVLNTRDPSSPTGWATFVSIKRLSDGVVLAEGYMNGQYPQGQPRPTPRFEADPNGGFREVRASVGDVGRLAAEQTLARLAGAL